MAIYDPNSSQHSDGSDSEVSFTLKKYTAKLKSGFELSIKAKNLEKAKVLASRAARGNDTVESVKWDRNASKAKNIY